MNFIFIERDVLGLSASAIRIKISGIGRFHVISEENGFGKSNARWGISLKGLATRNKHANRRLPYNADLSEDILLKLRIEDDNFRG